MPQCINHLEVPATGRCTGCAEPFCHTCLTEVAGQTYCIKCKRMAVTKPPVVESKMSLCNEAKSALICSLVGLFAFSYVLGPMAIYLGMKARTLVRSNPRLTGSGLAAAAIVNGIIIITLAIAGIALKAR